MADAVFIGVAVLTIGSAILALESRELIYGAIALAISMLGIARLLSSSGFSVCCHVPNNRLCWGCSCASYIRSHVGEDTRTLRSQRG